MQRIGLVSFQAGHNVVSWPVNVTIQDIMQRAGLCMIPNNNAESWSLYITKQDIMQRFGLVSYQAGHNVVSWPVYDTKQDNAESWFMYVTKQDIMQRAGLCMLPNKT